MHADQHTPLLADSGLSGCEVWASWSRVAPIIQLSVDGGAMYPAFGAAPGRITGVGCTVRSVTGSNLAMTQTERCWAMCREGDLDAAMGLMSEDFVHDDRRDGVHLTVIGPRETIEANKVALEVGFVPHFEPIAVHGDHLALARLTARSSNGFEMVLLQVLAVDPSGLRTLCVSFDEADIDEAVAELKRLGAGS